MSVSLPAEFAKAIVKANIIDQGMHEEMDFAMAGGVA